MVTNLLNLSFEMLATGLKVVALVPMACIENQVIKFTAKCSVGIQTNELSLFEV